jgi:hypothetical protein
MSQLTIDKIINKCIFKLEVIIFFCNKEVFMKSLAKLSTLLLTALLLAGMFASCNNTTTLNESTLPSESSATISRTESTYKIIADSESDYVIIRPTTIEDELNDAVKAFRVNIKEKTDVRLSIRDDFIAKDEEIPASAKEIIIGKTNRTESSEALAALKEKDYSISARNDRVVIIGGSDAATIEALEYFTQNYVDATSKKIELSSNTNETVHYSYRIGTVTLNGVALNKYSVIYDDNDLLAKYAAENFATYLKDISGYDLSTCSDKAAESTYELLIGNTNRVASSSVNTSEMAHGEYALTACGDKIVIAANGYMVGAGASSLINDYILASENGESVNIEIAQNAENRKFDFKKAENAILLIGDGMGFNQINATILNGLANFYPATLPATGMVSTYSYSESGNKSTTDSAASATALATGYKSINGRLGLNRNGDSVQNVRELAASLGAKTAILSNDLITGATPAAFLVHTDSRKNTDEIQRQINELTGSGAVTIAKGSIPSDTYIDQLKDALTKISSDGSRFFMMAEETRCDAGGHSNVIDKVYDAVNNINDLSAYLIEFVILHPDTILIITADHETGGLSISDTESGKAEFTTTGHTNSAVPFFAIGYNTDQLGAASHLNNVQIAKFIAKIYGDSAFGNPYAE